MNGSLVFFAGLFIENVKDSIKVNFFLSLDHGSDYHEMCNFSFAMASDNL